MFFFKSRSRAELETGFSLEAGRWELLVSFSGPRDGRNVCIDSPPGHCWIHSGTQIWALTICIVSVFELHRSLRVGRRGTRTWRSPRRPCATGSSGTRAAPCRSTPPAWRYAGSVWHIRVSARYAFRVEGALQRSAGRGTQPRIRLAP